MKLLHFLLSLLALTIAAGCSSSPPPVELDTVKEGKPALWKVTGTQSRQQGTAYLFGTIHILPPAVSWRSAELDQALATSDRLVIEVLGLEDTQKAARIFAKLAISPDQPEIETRIKPSLRDDLERVIDRSDIPEFALNRMESWAAALSLASAQTNGLGLDSNEGVERQLVAEFEAAKKAVKGLETIEQQLGYFDQLPESQQREMLTSVVEEADDAKSAFEELFNAWITGDSETIAELSKGGILEDPATRNRLLVARNRDWTGQIDKMLQQPGTYFVGVGAAHLVGPDSVQNMLEPLGYKIERVQ